MNPTDRYSEPYTATGGLAGQGVINQLGRPDIEAFEMLVREAVQNSWDARRANQAGITVEIGLQTLDERGALDLAANVLPQPPGGLRLKNELRPGMQLLYFADFGTEGLSGPTRADRLQDGSTYDFVDFVRNIGSPPDKEFGGGSFGYGKAAFYIASRARTILIDTLCLDIEGVPERRFIACALGDTFNEGGRPHTGRHWWGRLIDGVPEPLTGQAASDAARLAGLPDRASEDDLGTTIAVLAPDFAVDDRDGASPMAFIGECLVWNFWPRMIDTRGGVNPTMSFRLLVDGKRLQLPDPRGHERLRDFTEAMDVLRTGPNENDPFVISRTIACYRPIQDLGQIVIVKGPVAPVAPIDGPAPQGARAMAKGVHHVALMRSAELVVRYLPGPQPTALKMGYAGVFQCDRAVDQAFRSAEPPTHDDWVFRSVHESRDRTFVKVGLERIRDVCREAAGHGTLVGTPTAGAEIPLGEFAESLGALMTSMDGPSARRTASSAPSGGKGKKKKKQKEHSSKADDGSSDEGREDGASWVDATDAREVAGSSVVDPARSATRPRTPQTKEIAPLRLSVDDSGTPVLTYAFRLRTHENPVRLSAVVEVMTNDGRQVEGEPPIGSIRPEVRSWIGPDGARTEGPVAFARPGDGDGDWTAIVEVRDEALMRIKLDVRRIDVAV